MPNRNISRRVFIGAASYVVSAPVLAGLYKQSYRLYEVIDDGQFFTASELSMLVDIAEIMIPKTDTPGATDVNVISVLDGLMVTWAGSKTKQQYRYILSQVDVLSMGMFHSSYGQLPHENRQALILHLDKIAFEKKSTALSKSYRHLKKMIFHVYYTSEEANPDYILIPGEYRGDISQKERDAILARGSL